MCLHHYTVIPTEFMPSSPHHQQANTATSFPKCCYDEHEASSFVSPLAPLALYDRPKPSPGFMPGLEFFFHKGEGHYHHRGDGQRRHTGHYERVEERAEKRVMEDELKMQRDMDRDKARIMQDKNRAKEAQLKHLINHRRRHHSMPSIICFLISGKPPEACESRSGDVRNFL
ncbi:hypothetical protein FOL47_010415 [Perkinsus chesapeaki]|uniref:Uncharacterized protein n=1 Tax=Perkinsus chesapeaki TaxID=330153 RepID=A0A7J6L390_PERCH|nr:hypothetical protein FOL47_010415 [Perkinsus chesapeaki]